jgi:hypothetical protein
MLSHKRFVEMIQSYTHRAEGVQTFLRHLRPDLTVQVRRARRAPPHMSGH